MAALDVPVVRIIVDGCPAPKSIRTNVPQACGMLLRAFESNRWPGKAMFAVTPGGFLVSPFRLHGKEGADGHRAPTTSRRLSSAQRRSCATC